jgi:hypothetical protein
LEITDRLMAVGRYLDELRDLQARAIALAASSGVPQRVLADIAGVSAPRISQIVRSQPVDIDARRLHDEWFSSKEWPAERFRELSGAAEDQARGASFRAYVAAREQPASGGGDR